MGRTLSKHSTSLKMQQVIHILYMGICSTIFLKKEVPEHKSDQKLSQRGVVVVISMPVKISGTLFQLASF
jgi:hypothetical protein